LFLFSYKGFDANDNKITNLAAFCAVLVALFPTNSEKVTEIKCMLFNLDHNIIGNIHLLAAGCFFLVLGAYSYFWFTKFGPSITRKKLKRNKIYRVCGIIMFGTIVTMILLIAFEIKKGNAVFWLETIGLLAFGISWLIKGETILADDKNEQLIIIKK
jgi:drug/metabolite transporter (DMT)-like permease